MPKRKREAYDSNGDRVLQAQKQDVYDNLAQSKKLLHRALKTAKGFERQKLGKRVKLAAEKPEDVARINREIEALKGLDLGKVTDAHLHKTFLKVKAFSESELLPEEVRKVVPKSEASEEMAAALNNVTSGMLNMKPVKEVMNKAVSGMYLALGIPAPVHKPKGGKKEPVKGILKDSSLRAPVTVEITHEDVTHDIAADRQEESLWEGFESTSEKEEDADGEEKEEGVKEDIKYESLDENELSRYDALLGGSSDEESFDEVTYTLNRPSKPSTLPSLSPSPSPSPSQSLTLSPERSPELQPEPNPPCPPAIKATKTKKTKDPPVKAGTSTFLPTLMGGYWSGSEESASDLEEDAAPIKPKNRPGQMARRAIWEKKFGKGANHIKTGKGSVADHRGNDDGWDAKRGAKDGGARGRGRQRDFSQVTGENAMPVEPRKRGLGRNDDVGVLHPSWQAAKKAKDAKKSATFSGTKVTFD